MLDLFNWFWWPGHSSFFSNQKSQQMNKIILYRLTFLRVVEIKTTLVLYFFPGMELKHYYYYYF